MKKGLLIILVISIVFSTTSCSIGKTRIPDNKSSITVNNEQSTLIANGETPKQRLALKSPAEISGTRNYEIIEQTYHNGEVTINYPQITGLSDVNKQRAINDMIKTDTVSKFLDCFKNSDGILNKDELSLRINYTVKWQSSNLLSIQYTGVSYSKGAAHPNSHFYTTNIDINKGLRLRLKDLVIIDERFVEIVKDGKFIAVSPDVKTKLGSAFFTNEKLIKDCNQADVIDRENLIEGYAFSYLTDDSLGISMGVLHAAGNHVQFEVKYQDIVDSIKTENEVWKEFFK